MNNINIEINKKFLFYALLVFMIAEPVILYTKLNDEYLSTKALFCFIYSFVLILLIFASNSIKEINKKSSILVPSLIMLIIIIINVLAFISSPYINAHTPSKQFNYLLFGPLGRNEGIFVWLVNLIFLFSAYFAINTIREIKIFLKVSILMANVVAFDGLLQFLFGKDILFLWARPIERYRYCFSLLGNQNFVGNFLSLLMPISLGIYFLIENKYKYAALIYYLSTILQFSCLLCSRTRGAWIGVGFSLLLVVVLSIKYADKSYYKRLITIFIGFIAVFLVINNVSDGAIYTRASSLTSNVKAAISGDETSGTKRIFLWKHSIKYIEKRPVLGWGTNSMPLFFKVSPKTALKNWGNSNIIVDKAHNEYLQMAADTGVPALFLYIGLLVLIFIYGLRSFSRMHKQNNVYLLILITSIIGYSISLFFSFAILTYSTWFFIIIGVMLKTVNVINTMQLNGGVLIEK